MHTSFPAFSFFKKAFPAHRGKLLGAVTSGRAAPRNPARDGARMTFSDTPRKNPNPSGRAREKGDCASRVQPQGMPAKGERVPLIHRPQPPQSRGQITKKAGTTVPAVCLKKNPARSSADESNLPLRTGGCPANGFMLPHRASRVDPDGAVCNPPPDSRLPMDD